MRKVSTTLQLALYSRTQFTRAQGAYGCIRPACSTTTGLVLSSPIGSQTPVTAFFEFLAAVTAGQSPLAEQWLPTHMKQSEIAVLPPITSGWPSSAYSV